MLDAQVWPARARFRWGGCEKGVGPTGAAPDIKRAAWRSYTTFEVGTLDDPRASCSPYELFNDLREEFKEVNAPENALILLVVIKPALFLRRGRSGEVSRLQLALFDAPAHGTALREAGRGVVARGLLPGQLPVGPVGWGLGGYGARTTATWVARPWISGPSASWSATTRATATWCVVPSPSPHV